MDEKVNGEIVIENDDFVIEGSCYHSNGGAFPQIRPRRFQKTAAEPRGVEVHWARRFSPLFHEGFTELSQRCDFFVTWRRKICAAQMERGGAKREFGGSPGWG
jgi:hypothetical protein